MIEDIRKYGRKTDECNQLRPSSLSGDQLVWGKEGIDTKGEHLIDHLA